MNIIICDDLYLHTVKCAPIVLHPLLKGYVMHLSRGGNFHLKVGGAKSSGNAGDPMLGVAVIP